MPTVKSRNVYKDTTFHLITIKDGKLDLKTFIRVGQKANGTNFINETKGVSNGQYVLIGTHLDDGYDLDPTVITDIEDQRKRVFEYLQRNFCTFNPASVEL